MIHLTLPTGYEKILSVSDLKHIMVATSSLP